MKLRYDRLFIAIFIGSFIISGILYLSSVLVINFLVEHSQNTHLNEHTEVLTVESIKYTTPTQTNVQDTPKQKNRLCGLAVVECENEIEEKCNLDEVSCLIKEVAEEYGIDWKIAVAISKWETGNYTSKAFKEKNNLFGMMFWNSEIRNTELMTFNTMKDGIIAGVKNLKKNYFDMGLTTLEAIQQKYAPINAKNDPNKLNNYWLSGTTEIYESLEV